MPRLADHTEPKVLFSMRVHPGILKASREAAREQADTLTGYIEQALRERLHREGHLPSGAKED